MRNIWDDYLIPLGATLLLVAFLCVNARAETPRFSVEFRPMKADVAVVEILWQAENAVDYQQTMRIANEPARYREVGTLSLFTGPHPSRSQVLVGSVLAGVGHYAVAQVLTNAHLDNAARVWEYVNLGYKTWDINRNYRAGLGGPR